nr:glutathione peroxidase [Marivibrio halodurans]
MAGILIGWPAASPNAEGGTPVVSGTESSSRSTASQTAHAFQFDGLDGAPITLRDHAGGPILVVNTASLCGYTGQYEGLQALHERYADRGLTVVGVPSDDFGGQEYETAAEIKAFCTGAYGVTFPLAARAPVRGAEAHPFYRWARETLGADKAPRWNFHKYLIAPDGRLVAAFDTRIEPRAPEVLQAIEALLPAM